MKMRITFWRVASVAILAAFAVATYQRFTQGLGGVTKLSDQFPWGLWIGFDILCGVGLAAGGFTLAAMVYLFGWERYRPVLRPAILTAFLGYVLVVFALLFDLGKPWNVWHPIIMHNPHSVMFEVGWCVMLYTTVLAMEFAPSVWERLRWGKGLRVWKRIMVPLVLAGVLLSTLHQSSLGSLFLILPQKLHPLWYSSLLPVFFFVSAVAVGLAVVMVESCLSNRAYGKEIEWPILSDLGKFMIIPLLVLGVLKGFDLFQGDGYRYLLDPTLETGLFWLENIALIIAPIIMIVMLDASEKPRLLMATAFSMAGGFMLNRLNISITALDSTVGANYFPSWQEIVVSVGVVTVGVIAFGWVVKHLPIYDHQPLIERWAKPVYTWSDPARRPEEQSA